MRHLCGRNEGLRSEGETAGRKQILIRSVGYVSFTVVRILFLSCSISQRTRTHNTVVCTRTLRDRAAQEGETQWDDQHSCCSSSFLFCCSPQRTRICAHIGPQVWATPLIVLVLLSHMHVRCENVLVHHIVPRSVRALASEITNILFFFRNLFLFNNTIRSHP